MQEGGGGTPQVPSTAPVESGPVHGAGALLQLLRDGQNRTRAQLAAETGLARSTITQRVDALLASDLIGPADRAMSTGGRPPTRFAFNPSARVVLAVDIGASHVRVALTDLAGGVLCEAQDELAVAEGPEKVLGWVETTGRRLLADGGRRLDDLLGVGVGLPGPVEHSTGRPTNPPIMPGWDGFDVQGYLQERLQAIALADNDVNIMTLGEHFAHWRDSPHLMFVKVATGIGSGLISDGRLHRGAQGAAGDMGHVQLPRGSDIPCRCGNVGCLEAVASGAAVAAQLRAQGIEAHSSRDVVTLARNGSVEALQLLRQAGRDLGDVLAMAVSLFNPSVLVVGGSLSHAGDHLIAGVREVVYSRSLPLATQSLRITKAQSDYHGGIIGAAVMVIDHALSPAHVDKLIAFSRNGS